MLRKVILAVALAAGTGTAMSAVPPFPQPRVPEPAPIASSIEGWWYMAGDPRQPCYIEFTGRGPFLVLTNERGEQSRGRALPGQRIIADDWGNLIGDVRGNEIFWRNGDRWSR
jgi:hypothetical protein